ncbi:NAD(P)H-dependent oxidoreductase [Streptomyces sp. F63]|uniref:NAD(P)H-dependent oxidoreductase n=1 Tax=Streptomyces sp. F63 TaxID=2824887 RepID=UPI001B36FB1F|nr:NAD(P)H-dependent oxidoreductase [Streptomyces sp. F63]MBQ0986979.1 NAD(P)H-dependent oxidoreductase [Streptomyces sp. F63]
MRVLWIHAHPEPRSLSAALRDEGLRALRGLGHEHRQSDLYAMGWNPVVDRRDFPGHEPDRRLLVSAASEAAHLSGRLSADIRAEQEKIRWADTLIVQFPLWWFGPPAILKGWFDRVFVKGFAYGVRDQEDGRTLRYGDGGLAGRRAMAVVTTGGAAPAFGPRGVNGDLDSLLFPLHHGTFWYTGMAALPPFAVYGADRLDAAGYAAAAAGLRERLRTLPDTEPIPYRREAGGEYGEDLVLRPDIEPGRTGPAVHRADPVPAGRDGGRVPCGAGER